MSFYIFEIHTTNLYSLKVNTKDVLLAHIIALLCFLNKDAAYVSHKSSGAKKIDI